MNKKLYPITLALLILITGMRLKADQIDADPQSSQNQNAPPQEAPPPSAQSEPRYEPPVEPRYEPEYRRRGWRRYFRRDYPDDAWVHLRVMAKVYYDFAGTGYSNNASISNNFFSSNGALSVTVTNALGFGAEVFTAPPFGVGFSGGLEYELTRNITGLNNPNVSVTYTSPQPTLQFTTIYANGIFRWLNFYIPLGLNYSIPNFSGASGNGLITNSTFTGNIGFQFGLGYLIGDHFAFELQDRTVQFGATSTANNTSLNWGTVSLSGLHLSLKYAF